MGAQPSCEVSDLLRDTPLDQLVANAEFREHVETELWPQMSETTKKYISDLGKTPVDRLRSIWEADVTVLDPAHSKIAEWTVCPPQLDVEYRSALDACKKLVVYTRRKDATYEDDICRRFQYCVLYSLYRVSNISRKAFATELVPLIDQEDVRVIDISQYWMATGNNLLELACRLGGYGILLVLPSQVPRSVWESHLRRTSVRFEDAVEELGRRGIREVAEVTGANYVGEKIAQRLGLPKLTPGKFP